MSRDSSWRSYFICDEVVEHYRKEIQKAKRKKFVSSEEEDE